jgi:hypothetical protein
MAAGGCARLGIRVAAGRGKATPSNASSSNNSKTVIERVGKMGADRIGRRKYATAAELPAVKCSRLL